MAGVMTAVSSSSQRHLGGEAQTSDLGQLHSLWRLKCFDPGDFLHTNGRYGSVKMSLEPDRTRLLAEFFSIYHLQALQDANSRRYLVRQAGKTGLSNLSRRGHSLVAIVWLFPTGD